MEEGAVTFSNLGLSPKVLKSLEEMGFEEPSPIQAKTIPLIMSGVDIVGQAQTGTGKTAAFGVPIVERIDPKSHKVEALILTPTRELAIQVAGEIAKIGKHREIKTLPVYGGQPIDRQIRSLHFGVPVVIGTPGRLIDHLKRGTLTLDAVSMLVMDEADEMLDMGFIEDIEFILEKTPADKQTMLFSATMPEQILRLAKRYLKDPQRVAISPEALTVPLISQEYYECRGIDRVDALSRILDMEDVERGIIFCRTKKGVDELAEGLQARGYLAEAIHGDLNQAQRNRVMKRFREGAIELLVATDVAARGLDIENITHVVNYDVPQDPESYVHRIGRTGRAGKTGAAITLIHPREFKQLKLIERVTKTRIIRREVPSLADLAEKQREALKGRLTATIAEGSLWEYREIVNGLVEEYDPMDLAAAALKMTMQRERDDRGTDDSADYGDTGAEPGMVRLFINIGRQQGIGPADVVRSIAGTSGIPGSVIGMINIYDKFSFVEVPGDVAAKVMEAMDSATIKGRSVNIEPAKKR